MTTNNKILLAIAGLLILIGLLQPNFGGLLSRPQSIDSVVLVEPNESFKPAVSAIVDALSTDSDRKVDGKRLASMANDISTLIALDGENEAIKNTEEIRQINKLVGPMLKLDIKGKYPELAKASQDLIVSAIGDDVLLLDKDLRIKASEAFKALAWAYNEGAK
jgi:hypothetical protein